MATALKRARAEVERLELAEQARAEALARLEERVAALRRHWSTPWRQPTEAYVARTWELHGLVADVLETLGGVADLSDGVRLTLSELPRGVQFWGPNQRGRREYASDLVKAEARARELAAQRATG